MKPALLWLAVLAGLTLSCTFVENAAARGSDVPPGLILVGGRIFTGVRDAPFVEALAVHNGRISAVGTSKEIDALASAATRRIELHGRTVVPGFNDAHVHFSPDAPGVSLPFETMEPSWEEVQVALTALVAKTPAGTFITGSVGRRVVLNEAVSRLALDRMAPDHPVLLIPFYGHGFIVNSAAISNLGIAEDEADPMGGHYERVDRSMRINGRVWEYAQWKIVRTLAAWISDQQMIAALRALANEAVGFGITSMQVFPSMPVDRFLNVLHQAKLPVRIRAMAFPPTSPSGRDQSEIRDLGAASSADTMVTASGIKWILDGTPIEHGAAMRAPYSDRPDLTGRANFPENEIAKMIDESLTFDQQLLLHASGDRTAELVLQALEARATAVDWPEKRVRIEHGDGVYGDLSVRAQRLGVIVVQNPSHFVRELVGDRFAPDTPFFELRSNLERGVVVALGSDGPMNPFLNIMLASLHPMRPEQAITREQAVRAYTTGSAFAEFAEHKKGTIEPGKLADLAVLSGDLFTVNVDVLPTLRSVLTLIEGDVVFEDPSFARAAATPPL